MKRVESLGKKETSQENHGASEKKPGQSQRGKRRGRAEEKASDSTLTLQGVRIGAWMLTSKRTLL